MMERVYQATMKRNADYPHYDEECRGLPAEIRMKIWRYALDTVLHIDQSFAHRTVSNLHHVYKSNHGDAYSSAIRRPIIRNLIEFPFLNLLLLDKRVSSEVIEAAEASVTWHFPRQCYPQTTIHLLSSFSSSQKHVTKEVSLTADSLEPGVVCNSYGPVCFSSFEAFQDIDSSFRPAHPYSLSVRIAPLHLPSSFKLPSDYGQSFDSYSARDLENRFAQSLLEGLWDRSVTKTMHHLVVGGHIAEFRLQQPGHCEAWSLALSDPVKVLLDMCIFFGYWTPSELNELVFRLDWPVGSDLLSICITKEVEQH